MMQADLKGKFDRILNSELAKLGEESRELEEQRAADFAAFAEEEAALRSALEEKRQEREAVHSEVSGLGPACGGSGFESVCEHAQWKGIRKL